MRSQGVVIVSGASSGIGLATAKLLASEGYRVFGTRLPSEAFAGEGFEVLDLDIRSDDSVAACIAEVIERAGQLDVLFNCAGVGLVGPVEETALAECRAMFEINYFGTVRMIRAALPVMRAQHSGLIINTSSVAGYIGVPFEAHYCAAKLAIDSMSRALRYEVAQFGINVSILAPGYVRTPFYKVQRTAAERIAAYDHAREMADRSFDEAARAGSEAPAIARLVLSIVRSKSPTLRYYAGKDASIYGYFHRFLPRFLAEFALRRKFVPPA